MRGDQATSAFAGEPQPVEVYHRGIWYLGELLGWQHLGDGRCLARVRCVVDGLRHSAWKDLADLRLPEPVGTDVEDDVPEEDADRTRPHVLLADQRARPRKPVHALVPPPRWTGTERAERAELPPAAPPATAPPATAPPNTAPPNTAPAATAPAARRDEVGNWRHLRRGGSLSRL